MGAFTKVDRDPRERVITIAFYAILDSEETVCADDDAARARWFSIANLPPLAFDHAHILRETMKRIRFLL